MAKLSKEQLISAADEMYKVMGIDKPVDPEKTEAEIKKWIAGAAKLYKPEEDEFSEDTYEILSELGHDLERPGEPEPDEPEEPATLVEQLDAEDDMRELKAMVKANDEFKSLRSSLTKYKVGQEEDLKEAMFELLTPDEEPEPVKKAPAKKALVNITPGRTKGSTPRYSRVDSVCDVLKNGKIKTFDALVEAADDLYAENGGKSNIKESRFAANYAVAALKHFDIDVPE